MEECVAYQIKQWPFGFDFQWTRPSPRAITRGKTKIQYFQKRTDELKKDYQSMISKYIIYIILKLKLIIKIKIIIYILLKN